MILYGLVMPTTSPHAQTFCRVLPVLTANCSVCKVSCKSIIEGFNQYQQLVIAITNCVRDDVCEWIYAEVDLLFF